MEGGGKDDGDKVKGEQQETEHFGAIFNIWWSGKSYFMENKTKLEHSLNIFEEDNVKRDTEVLENGNTDPTSIVYNFSTSMENISSKRKYINSRTW